LAKIIWNKLKAPDARKGKPEEDSERQRKTAKNSEKQGAYDKSGQAKQEDRIGDKGMIGKDWKPIARLFTLPAILLLALGGLILWHDRAALGAQRVLAQDKVMVPAAKGRRPEAQPAPAEAEDSRFIAGYSGETESLAVSAGDLTKGFLILVNYAHLLPENYSPEDLATTNPMAGEARDAGFGVTKAGLQVDRTAAEQLLAMVRYAYEQDGITGYLLQSGHRDVPYQKILYQNKVRHYKSLGYADGDAETAAAVWVARPQESEHHTGLAMDVSSRSHPELETSYYQTANGLWLDENCWRFGFLVRYPEDKTPITKIGYEPWHLRYVGRPHSDYIRQQRWCLEEYYDFLYAEGGYTFRDEQGALWQINYQPLGEEGAVTVPADRPYTVSGDGSQGFVITILLEPADR
jgi:D-alanyl-D-alanine carboxypeptidase